MMPLFATLLWGNLIPWSEHLRFWLEPKKALVKLQGWRKRLTDNGLVWFPASTQVLPQEPARVLLGLAANHCGVVSLTGCWEELHPAESLTHTSVSDTSLSTWTKLEKLLKRSQGGCCTAQPPVPVWGRQPPGAGGQKWLLPLLRLRMRMLHADGRVKRGSRYKRQAGGIRTKPS